MGFKKIVTLFILSALSITGVGQKYSNDFLNLGAGVRASGMGNAVVASTFDVTAGYWNPAGLNGLENNIELGWFHSERFAGIVNYDYAGFGFKIDEKSSAGFSFVRAGVDDIPDTRQLVDANGNFDYNRITTFSSVDNAFMLHYARQVGPEALNVGGTMKIIYRKVGPFANAVGFGFDVSATYDLDKIKLGMILKDITGTWNAWRFNQDELTDVFTVTGNDVPENSLEVTRPQAILGGGYDYQISEKFGLYPEVNLSVTFDGKRNTLIKSNLASIDPRVGVEANYLKMFFLRVGIDGFQQASNIDGDTNWKTSPSLGLGIKFKKVQLDYALNNTGFGEGFYANSFSLKFGINKRK